MKIISFNTLHIKHEKQYNPNSQIFIDYPDDNVRLLKICEIILENIYTNTIICLQECSSKLLSFLVKRVPQSYNIFSAEIEVDEFMITISHRSLEVQYDYMPKYLYEKFAYGYLTISNDNFKIINCHLRPQFTVKNYDIFSEIKDVSTSKKCIVAGDFNENRNKLLKCLKTYSIPQFGITYKNKKDLDHIIFNFDAEFTPRVLDTYDVSDHCAICLDIIL